MKRIILSLSLAVGMMAGPASADEVVMAGGADILAMNAIDVVVSIPDRMLMDHISDTLLVWEEPGKLGAGLATEWNQIDDVTWEFTLRDDVTFQNGEPFNAASVKFTYDTLIDPDLVSPGKSNHSYVKEVQIIDDYKVRLITNEPFPITLAQVTFMHMIPPEYFAEVGLEGYRSHPIGTGPYEFVEHVPDSYVLLKRFEAHWRGPAPIETLRYRVITEDATRVGALLAGEVDLVLNVPPELTTLISGSDRGEIKTSASTRSYLLTMADGDDSLPTSNVLVREAINYAIDRHSLSEHLFEGTFVPASWLSPDVFGFNPDIEPFPYHPDRARELLAEAGYPDGFDIELDAPYGRYLKDRELAEALAGQLAEVGIRVNVNTYEFGVFTNRIFNDQANPLVLFAWAVSKGDPESHLRFVLSGDGSWNSFSDPEMNDLIDLIDVEMNSETRAQLIHDLQVRQREVLPAAYLMIMADIYGASHDLDWWQPRSDEKILLFNY